MKTHPIIIFFLLIVFSCTVKHHLQMDSKQNSVSDIYFTGKAVIDTLCIERIRFLVSDSLTFKPNYHDCVSTNKYKKAIVFGVEADSGKFIFGGPGAFVAINDTCGIDTIISSSKKINTSK